MKVGTFADSMFKLPPGVKILKAEVKWRQAEEFRLSSESDATQTYVNLHALR